MNDAYQTFVDSIEARTPASCSTSQSGLHIQYGNSRVDVRGNGNDHFILKGRKEGDEGHQTNWTDMPRTLEVTSLEDALDWVVDILSTGRTCEVGKGIGLRKLNTWPPFSPVDYDFEYLKTEVLSLGKDNRGRPAWNLTPDYQRGAVWTKDQQSKFIGHLLEGGQAPLLFVQRYDSPTNAPAGHKKDYYDLPVEVIDGQQRIRAILAWMANEIPAEVADGRLFWYRDTNEIDRRCLPHAKIAILDIPRKERLEFYLKINNGGTIHTAEEINKVRELLAKEKKGGV
jgi:hypothetical protein